MNIPFLGVIFVIFIFYPLSQLIINHSDTKEIAEKRVIITTIIITTIILAIAMIVLGIIDKLFN